MKIFAFMVFSLSLSLSGEIKMVDRLGELFQVSKM